MWRRLHRRERRPSTRGLIRSDSQRLPKIGEALESGPVARRVRDRCGEFDEGCAGWHPRWSRNSDSPPRPLVGAAGRHRCRSSPPSSSTRRGPPSRTGTTSSAPACNRDLISPFYSPCIGGVCVPGAKAGFAINWFRLSPALLILIFPLGLSAHLLLLPTQLLPRVLVVPALLRRRRRPRQVLRRDAGSRSSCRTSTGTSSTPGSSSTCSSPIDAVEAFREPGLGWGVSVGHARAVRERGAALDVLPQLPRLSPPLRRPRQELQGPSRFAIASGRS